MTRQAALEQPTVSMTALLMRWLVLVFIALDLISAPLHAHAHDLGPAQFTVHSHADQGGHADPLDIALHAEAVDHAFGHSSAVIRSVERDGVAAPSLAFIVAGVAALQWREPADIEADEPWPDGADPIPLPGRRAWRPEGRAPPALHS